MELVIFQQYTKIIWFVHVGLATDTWHFTLLLYSAGISQQLFLSLRSSYKQKICGIMVHHSCSLHSVRQLYNSALAQLLVVWPDWSYTSNLEPTPKLHSPAPTPCLCIFKLAYKLVLSHDKLPNHLSIRGKINQYVGFFHALFITRTTCKQLSNFKQLHMRAYEPDKLSEMHSPKHRNTSCTNSLL